MEEGKRREREMEVEEEVVGMEGGPNRKERDNRSEVGLEGRGWELETRPLGEKTHAQKCSVFKLYGC